MEKINKEELMKKLNLTEEDLEKVAGGGTFENLEKCWENCSTVKEQGEQECNQPWNAERYAECVKDLSEAYENCTNHCVDYGY